MCLLENQDESLCHHCIPFDACEKRREPANNERTWIEGRMSLHIIVSWLISSASSSLFFFERRVMLNILLTQGRKRVLDSYWYIYLCMYPSVAESMFISTSPSRSYSCYNLSHGEEKKASASKKAVRPVCQFSPFFSFFLRSLSLCLSLSLFLHIHPFNRLYQITFSFVYYIFFLKVLACVRTYICIYECSPFSFY